MQPRTQNYRLDRNGSSEQKDNKGFTLHLGDLYIGYLTIASKNLPLSNQEALQNPTNMQSIFSKLELRPYDESTVDTTELDLLLSQGVVSE